MNERTLTIYNSLEGLEKYTHVHTPSYMYNVISVRETRQMQATTPKDNSFFSREKQELPRAGLEPAIFCVLDRCCTS